MRIFRYDDQPAIRIKNTHTKKSMYTLHFISIHSIIFDGLTKSSYRNAPELKLTLIQINHSHIHSQIHTANMATHQKHSILLQKKRKIKLWRHFPISLLLTNPKSISCILPPRLASPIINENTKVTKRNQMKILSTWTYYCWKRQVKRSF